LSTNLWKVRYRFEDIIGTSQALDNAVRQAHIAAKSNVSVLITGESGTGKEIFAQSIHEKSKRGNKPFVSLNCSAISRELVEAELFGYAPGAYTGALSSGNKGKFQLANNGTLFLDEIGEMPLTLQAKLLRVISEGEIVKVGGSFPEKINVRLIFATNRNLEYEVEEGNFREDLFYRINPFTISIPPLRERPEDISLIAKYMINNLTDKMEMREINLSEKFLKAIEKYNWPGNVRELQGILERELLHLNDEEYEITHVPNKISNPKSKDSNPLMKSGKLISIPEMEKELIKKAIEIYGRDNNEIYGILGISRSSYYRKRKEYGLDQD